MVIQENQSNVQVQSPHQLSLSSKTVSKLDIMPEYQTCKNTFIQLY